MMNINIILIATLLFTFASAGAQLLRTNQEANADFHQVKLDQGKGYAICTGSESYYTPDPDNCHNFFGCVYDEHNDFFHVYKFECQTGLAYDPNTHS